jgi:cysteine desulfurase
MSSINLDNYGSNPLHPTVKEKMIDYLNTTYGNPSSQHSIGDPAAEALEQARYQVRKLINADEKEIVFCSSGTESVNMAVKGVAFARRDEGKHIVTSDIEHNAVLRSMRRLRMLDWKVTSVSVDKTGLIDPDEVAEAIRPDTVLVTIMHANNEIGVIEPISEIAQICRQKKVTFHTDAVASTGVIPVDVKELDVDLLSLAANQFNGPSGAAALYIRRGTKIWPLLDGGVQERGRRAGLENMIGRVGLGEAARLASVEMDERIYHTAGFKHKLLEDLNKTIPDIIINGHPEKSLPNLVSVSIKGVEGESIMLMLDDEGICVATRSACAAGALQASHVLLSIGLDFTEAQGTLLITFGRENRYWHIDKLMKALPPIVEHFRKMSPVYP